MKHKKNYDIIVCGGGHAGVEAALIASKLNCTVGLVTLDKKAVGRMSCNPAIGGLGKGHLVREIDALGGLMGVAADYSGIQFRLLNRSKGPAVQGPRSQIDRDYYKKKVQKKLKDLDCLTIKEAEVTDLIVKDYLVKGIVIGKKEKVNCYSVILTTGTFLNGKIRII